MLSDEEMARRLALLRVEHRDLDHSIEALRTAGLAAGQADQLLIARLKKRKLRLRDEISWIEDMQLPDIIA